MKYIRKIKAQRGQATLIMVIVIMSVLLVIIASVGLLTYNDLKTIGNSVDSSQSYYAAEAGIEDAVYRIARSKQYTTSYSLPVGSGSTQVDISGPLSALVVTSKGNISNRYRRLEVDLGTTQSSTNVSFNYGVQVGYGGLKLEHGSFINGNVFSNGPITGSGTNPGDSYITGTAVSANSPAQTADQTNNTPSSPPNSIDFRRASTNQDLAQSFQVSTSLPISKVQLYIKKTGSPTNATVRIMNDSSGNPGSTTIAQGTLTASSVTGSYGWLDTALTTNPQLTAGVTYWVVADNSTQNSSNYYTVGANNTYASGQAKVGQLGGTWNNTSPAGFDAYFKIFLGGTVGSIVATKVGTVSGDAWANTVTNSNVTGTIYCQVGSGNNKACNTTQADQTAQSFAISDANIDQWKTEAEAGGVISGDYTLINGATASLGPTKITGNMVLNNNVTLTLTGTVWVQGTVTISNNALVKLDPGYGSSGGVLLSDGFINLSNNTNFQGSGQADSYFLLISTNDCNSITPTSPTGLACTNGNSAISVSNNVGSVIVYSSRGFIELENNAAAKEVTGYGLELEENASVTYSTGLASAVFSSGPGGGFNINSWKEIE